VSKRNKKEQFAGSEHELKVMTSELEDLHNDASAPSMWAGISNMIDSVRGAEGTARPTSRRTFLLGVGAAAAGGAALMAVGATPGLAAAATRTESRLHPAHAAMFPPAGYTGDLAVAAVAASLENLAVYAYTAGLSAATAGKLGSVPPAVATFATTAKLQHTQHAAAWNAVLAQNGKAKITETNPTLTPTIQAAFGKVTDVTGLAQLALTLETVAAATYQAETSKLKSTSAIGLSASIEPVEMQHIAILYYVMGMYPGSQTTAGAPIAFSSTASAA
jgi:ferritin-like protein